MEAGSILQNAVERIPLVDHEGKSGAALERVLLADGQRLVVKRFSPPTDLVMALTGDTVGREYLLWSRGVLDRLPPLVGHPVVGGWVEPGVTVLVMRDLGNSPPDLTPLSVLIGLFSPSRLAPHADDTNPLAAITLHGWGIFAETVPDDVAGPVFDLLADPGPLVAALQRRPTTLIHGDLATSTCPSTMVSSLFSTGAFRPRPALRLALLSGLVWLGWNKALDAAENPDPEIRERERQDLDWWVGEGRRTLESGLL